MIKNLIKKAPFLVQLNYPMLLAMLALLVMGVLYIYSACYIGADAANRTLHRSQIVWGLIGLGVFSVCAAVDYRRLCSLSSLFYVGSVILLVAVLLFGVEISGGRRWIDLGIRVQPSEFAKLSLVLLLSWRLGQEHDNLDSWTALLSNGALAVVPVVLIMLEPDLGTSLVLVPTVAAILFVAGVKLRVLSICAIVFAVMLSLFLMAYILPAKLGASEDTQVRIEKFTLLKAYQRERIRVFLNRESGRLDEGWTRRQSEISVGSGGWGGKGYCKGTQNVLGFLPYSVAPTDFIFCVIAEEAGFVGATLAIALFLVLLLSGLVTAVQSRDRMGRLLCVGVVSMIFFHASINIAMTVGLVPITGLPLPLLSYGGSFTVTTMAALGIVQSVSIYGRRRERGYGE